MSLGALALAGCVGNGDGGGGGGASFDEHPSTRGIETAAVMGNPDSGKRIVAFEDPSCPTCAEFSHETLPDIEEDASAGDVAFYLRAVPVVRPWSETATPALYATRERDGDAFWTLLESYYDNQGSISTENVEGKTREYLTDTPVDADEVLGDVSDGTHEGSVETALEVFEQEAGQTPTFYLFDENGFVTDTSGARGYDVFSTALGL